MTSQDEPESLEVGDEGLTILSDPEEAEVDIVILHGLGGNPRKTFTHPDTNYFWPSHLPEQLPSARIMVYGYCADIESGGMNTQSVFDFAEALLMDLTNIRFGQEASRPVVLIGHSLGGTVIKQLLVSSAQRKDRDILSSTKVIFFLGTPHRGSIQLARENKTNRIGLRLGKIVNRQIPDNVKTSLEPRTIVSHMLNTNFMKIKGTVSIVNFHETRKMSNLGDLIVDQDSAVFDTSDAENYSVARDHKMMVKFTGNNDHYYRALYSTLRRKLTPFLPSLRGDKNEETTAEIPQECLESLRPSKSWRQQTLGTRRHQASLQTLWNNNDGFSNWLQSGSGFFHISGKPGSGKSTLMSDLVPLLKNHHSTDIVACHFFRKRNSNSDNNPRGGSLDHTFQGLLQSTLYQVLLDESSFFPCIADQWTLAQYSSCGEPEWSLDTLKSALFKVFTSGSHATRFCLMIDALDECDGSSNDAEEILDFLFSVMGNCKTSSLQVLISSQPLTLLTTRLPNVRGIRMENENKEDIESLVDEKWNQVSLDSSIEERSRLRASLLEKADGIFIWAKLALERLIKAGRGGGTSEEVWEALNEFPAELSEVFKMFLRKIEKDYRAECYVMLGIVLTARRPLTLTEFRLISQMTRRRFSSLQDMSTSNSVIKDNKTMTKRILSRCGGLLEVKTTEQPWQYRGNDLADADQQTVQLLHQSVRDFLLELDGAGDLELPLKDRLLAEGHAQLAQSCLSYFSMAEIRFVQQRDMHEQELSKTFVLLEYSVNNWEGHYSEAAGSGQTQLDQTNFSDLQERTFATWVGLYNCFHPKKKLEEDYSLRHFAVRHNISRLVRRMCEQGELNTRADDGSPGNFLCLAAMYGCKETVSVLLEHGASPDGNGYTTDRPVLLACEHGHPETLRLLLAEGAEMDDKPDGQGKFSSVPVVNDAWSPLALAAYSLNEEVINIVLERDQEAIKHRWLREYAVKCLIAGARKAASGAQGESKDRKVLSTVKELLPLLSIDSEPDYGIFTNALMPILCASKHYSPSSLQMLLDTQCGRSTRLLIHMFSEVCQEGGVSSVKYLTEACGEETTIFMTVKGGGNLLHSSVRNKDISVLQYLLDLKLEIDEQDKEGYTPTHRAALCGSEYHVALLLRYGADGSLRTNRLETPFHVALRNPCLQHCDKIMNRLLEQAGGDAQLPAHDGMQPIHTAAATGRLPMVEWLYQRGADMKARDDYSCTALHNAASSADAEAVKVIDYLVSRGLDPNDQDDNGKTPLHHIFEAYSLYQKASGQDMQASLLRAQRLVAHGANPSIQNEEGSTLLHLAVWRGHFAMIKWLMEINVDSSLETCQGRKAIDYARDEDVEVMGHLLSKQRQDSLA